MIFHLKYATDKSNKFTKYEVLDVISIQPMPDGCVRVTSVPFTDEDAKLEGILTIDAIDPVLYYGIFKVSPVDRDSDRFTTLIGMYGVHSQEYSGISWIETGDSNKVINYKQYVTSCSYIGIEPLSFLQYWLHSNDGADMWNLTKVPPLEYKDPDWLTAHMVSQNLKREETSANGVNGG